MELLSENDKKQLSNLLEKEMKDQVKLIYFTQGASELVIPGRPQCMYCRETEAILNELSSLSGLIELYVYDLIGNEELAKTYDIDKIPATIINGEKNKRIKFFGIPAGYEFQVLLEIIIMISQNKTKLKETSRNKLKGLSEIQGLKTPISIQVFVTPTCPYCTKMVSLAYQFAMESPYIESIVIEATEFPYLADKYGVYGVPKTIINDKEEIEGAVTEEAFLEHIFKSLKG